MGFKIVLIILSLFNLNIFIVAQNHYCNFTPNHTLCLYQGNAVSPACGRVEHQGIDSDTERELIVSLHNKLRAKIANGEELRGNPGPQPPGANMMELVWDPELEIEAQAWTNQCITDHDCPDCRTVERFRVGQNLYEFGHFSGSWERSAQGWYDEVEDFNNTFIDPFFVPKGLLLGHFTQLIWAQTYRIGCGKLFFYPPNSVRFGKQLFICNYGLAGNLIGSQLYQSGTPCSACPLGTTCSAKYPGLCSGEPEQPLTIRPPKFDIDFTHLNTLNIVEKPRFNPKDPPVIINTTVIESPVVPGKADRCVYSCKTDGGCLVSFQSDRGSNGASVGSCFSPSFGGSCSGIPLFCQSCLNPCVMHQGEKITFFINSTEPTIYEKLEQVPIPSVRSGNNEATIYENPVEVPATCLYDCQASGGCSVRIQSPVPVSGHTLGSCFPLDFGGTCSGTPDRCQECLKPCEGKSGEMLSLPAS